MGAGRVPYEEGYFTVPEGDEPPRLLGTRCRACGERFYPRRAVCARCLSEDVEETLLGPRGTLHTWTWLRFPSFGDARGAGTGHGAGQIDLAEGVRVQAVLEGERGDFRIGIPMEMVLAPAGTDAEGREIVMYRFRPAR
jgi:uncharacterized OB-fold protein